jgi:hypothetical protein
MERPRPEYEMLPVLKFYRASSHLILNLAFITLLRRKALGRLSDWLNPFWKGFLID